MELEALKAAAVQYLGIEREGVDCERCQISSIVQGDGTIDIAVVVLPPKELPKILPCSLNKRQTDN